MDTKVENLAPIALSLEICQANEVDARQVMAWRNDPLTRKNSFHSKEKKWEVFWPEFVGTYFSTSGLPPFFIRDGARRVGFIRFSHRRILDIVGDCLDISIMIDPVLSLNIFQRSP